MYWHCTPHEALFVSCYFKKMNMMQKIISIKEYPENQKLLSNGNWNKTEYYKLCCKSELWGCAFLVVLDKQITDKANEAIIYILERMVIEGEGWNVTLHQDIKGEDFIKFVLDCGYISDEKGWDILIPEFWKNYEEIVNGISNGKNFEINKNGNKTEDKILIQKEEILSATCFADKWNSRKYLVETKTKWAFFSWCTGA
jgi:hypothetical protein